MTTEHDKILSAIGSEEFKILQFHDGVISFFQRHPALNCGSPPIIHSIKSRVKIPEHIRRKCERKLDSGVIVTPQNVFDEITDIIGVRVLHLRLKQVVDIHQMIKEKVDSGDWRFKENPKAYSWDPETSAFFNELGIEAHIKDSYYTSVHYLVSPPNDNVFFCCEIQVRTLYEEIWGEIAHSIDYPEPCKCKPCQDQLKVLARLTATGTRLVESICETLQNYNDNRSATNKVD